MYMYIKAVERKSCCPEPLRYDLGTEMCMLSDGENHNDEFSRDDSFMYGWAERENHNDELSGDDSFMFGWAEGENHNIDELSGDDSCMYDTHDTYIQRIEWFWGCLKKESGWMYFGTWQVTQESLESLSVVVFYSFPKSNFYAFLRLFLTWHVFMQLCVVLLVKY